MENIGQVAFANNDNLINNRKNMIIFLTYKINLLIPKSRNIDVKLIISTTTFSSNFYIWISRY